MANRYFLSCECGERHSVDVSRAGGELACKCGKTISIPRLLQLKKLPVDDSADADDRGRNPVDARQIIQIVGWAWGGVFLVAMCFVLLSPPKVEDTLDVRTVFNYGGQRVRSDIVQISGMEQFSALATDEAIDHLSPVEAWWYWHYLKDGVGPSFALRDRYDRLMQRHWLWVGILGGLAAVGIITGGSATFVWRIQKRA